MATLASNCHCQITQSLKAFKALQWKTKEAGRLKTTFYSIPKFNKLGIVDICIMPLVWGCFYIIVSIMWVRTHSQQSFFNSADPFPNKTPGSQKGIWWLLLRMPASRQRLCLFFFHYLASQRPGLWRLSLHPTSVLGCQALKAKFQQSRMETLACWSVS